MVAATSVTASRVRILAATAIIALGTLSALGGWPSAAASDEGLNAGQRSLLAHLDDTTAYDGRDKQN